MMVSLQLPLWAAITLATVFGAFAYLMIAGRVAAHFRARLGHDYWRAECDWIVPGVFWPVTLLVLLVRWPFLIVYRAYAPKS